MSKINRIAVLGDGGWGTTLAIHLAHQGYPVKLWGAFPEYVRRMAQTRYNDKFLPGIKLPPKVVLTDRMDEAVMDADLIVLACPSNYVTDVVQKLKKCDFRRKTILSVIKGIDTKTHLRMSQIIEKELGRINLAVLSGPTIAMEVAQKIPSTAVIASKNRTIAQQIQKVFNSESFRIYTNSDIVGTEIAGSVKNIIAIACGVCDGLGFGTNTKAAILTRGLAEMARLGKALGSKVETFSGLTGLGDLVTTCVNAKSRNRTVGEQLGKGKSIKQITSAMSMVAEGVPTAKAVYHLSRKYRVPMPICTEVYKIIYKNKKASQAVKDLMRRKMKSE